MNFGFLLKFVLVAAISAAARPAPAVDVIATGLNSPRGIAISPDGNLYVAEAGTGGNGPCIPSSDGTTPCFGTTGSITRINLRTGAQDRVATGFPSLAGPTGDGAIGPAGISFQG
jgi:DNA-binding beta-propeller fold protein YncE